MADRNARTILTSSFVASILFVGLLIAPLFFATIVEAGELDAFFSIAGTSDETVFEWDTDSDIASGSLKEEGPASVQTGNVLLQCEIASVGTDRVFDASATNISTNLTHFSDGYYSYVHTDPGCDDGFVLIDSVRFASLEFVFAVDKADVVNSEIFNFIVHLETNTTFSFVELQMQTVSDSTGSVITPSVTISDRLDNRNIDSGEVISFPFTTQDRLLVDGSFDAVPVAGTRQVLRVILFMDDAELPATSEVVTFDGELSKTRDGVLTSVAKIIAFNIGYVLVGGLLVVVATPFVKWSDIFSGLKRRRDSRGVGDIGGIGAIAVIAVLIVGAFFLFGGGSFTSFFVVSLLPLSLAIFGIVLVSFTTRGISSPTMTFLLAGLAATIGFLVGVSIQNNWLPYDALYVAPFVSVLTGGASLTNAFAISAFFVVTVQIAGTLVALFNIAQTITTDDQVSLVQ